MSEELFCTVFTPTYNRKNTLGRLYESLCRQTEKEFEWLIVDDGSTDDTEEYIKGLIAEHKIEIIYKKKENGGKHRVINYGVEFARGKVFAIVDSDDYLTDGAISKIKYWFNDIGSVNDKKMIGVAGQKGYSELETVGTTFNGDYIDATSIERNKYNICGDKFEVFYTKVLKENKFPEIAGEKFLTEALLWNRLAKQGYYIRWYQDIIYICEYLENGLTDNRDKVIKNSPLGYALYIKEQVEFGDISLKQKLGYYSFYYLVRKHGKNLKQIAKEINANKITVIFATILRKLLRK